MTTYSEVGAACLAYNAAAERCGRDQFTPHFIAQQCGVPLEFFSAQSDAVLSSDLEALAAEVLRELEDETAAMLSGCGNGGEGPGSGPENKTFEDLIAAAGDLAEGELEGARRLINEAAELGFDNLNASELIRAIRASTKLLKPALDGAWKRAVKQVEDETARAAVQHAIEEAQARAELEQAEEAALREQRKERVAPIAEDPKLLARVVGAAHKLGVVREDVAIAATYLTITSRLLRRQVISLLRRGTAAAGKNYVFEQVLLLLPRGCIIQVSASSAKVLPYTGGEDPDALSHMVIYVPEASSLLAKDGKEHEMAGMLRTMISENRLVYQTVVVRAGGLPPAKLEIIKNGPISVLVTSARDNIEPEMLTRVAFADADETEEQSQLIIERALKRARAEDAQTADDEAEIELLRDLQQWLKDEGPYDVVVPFSAHVYAAFARTPLAVRIRRDINTLIAGVSASAVLHKAQREVDTKGRIVATLADYEIAWDAFNPGVSAFHNPQFAPGVIALVLALEGMVEKARAAFEAKKGAAHVDYRYRDDPDAFRRDEERFDGVVEATQAQLASALGLASKDTVSTRLSAAKVGGLIECVNETASRTVPRRYRVLVGSADLNATRAAPVFPRPAEVRKLMDDRAAYERAKAKVVEEAMCTSGPEGAAKAEKEFAEVEAEEAARVKEGFDVPF
jgi:hypothetical protein